MKLYNVANQSWWVPATLPVLLAVRIRTPEEYPAAIREKVQALADRCSQEDLVLLAQITPGAEPDPMSLVTVGLNQVRLGQLIMEGDPGRDAEPADEATALEAIQDQGELLLESFLG